MAMGRRPAGLSACFWPRTMEMLLLFSLPDDLFQEWIDFFPLCTNWNAMGCRVVDSEVHDLTVRLKSICQQPCLVDGTSATIFRPMQNQCRRLDFVGVP